MRDMHEQPAGWYRDPVQPNLHRYWSGERWSEWLGEERWAGDGPADERRETAAVTLGERAS